MNSNVGNISRSKYYWSKVKVVSNGLGLLWYINTRNLQFVRLLTNTSVLPSLLIGIITIFISFEHPFGISDFDNANPWLFIIIAFLLTGFTILGARFFFNALPPDEYANFSISGRKLSDAFKYISYEIWKECHYIEKDKILLDGFQKLLIKRKLDSEDIITLASKSMELDKRFSKRFNRIKKIDQMIVSLAASMDMPPQRLSDYLFQFSPDIYLHEHRITTERMRQVLNTIKPGKIVRHGNIIDKIEEVDAFIETIKRRKDYQEEIIHHSQLHTYIIDLSTDYGFSNALSSYCMALQQCAKGESDINTKVNVNRVAEKLSFIYHKRRMYPGFDLHAILLNCFKHSQSKDDRDFYDLLKNMTQRKDLINQTSWLINAGYLDLQQRVQRMVDRFDNNKLLQRREISRKFKSQMKTWLIEGKDRPVIFITQGFSSTVNFCLRRFLRDLEINKDFKASIGERMIYLYIINTPKEIDNEFNSMTRYNRYKFKEDERFKEREDLNVNVRLGNLSGLRSLLSEGDFQTFILSGAEFVQTRTIKLKEYSEHEFRFSNDEDNRLFSKVKNSFIKNGNEAFIKHLILVENYKVLNENVSKELIFRSALNRTYSENQNIHGWDSNVILITGT